MSVTSINLDELEIDLATNIVGPDSNSPTPPGVVGRIAYAKDTNILYFAEDESTWIKFMPQEALAGGGIGSNQTVGQAQEGVATAITGAHSNGYFLYDKERSEIGIYYSGTALAPETPSVIVFEGVDSYESILLENIYAAPTADGAFGQTFSAPERCWDPEYWSTSSNREQSITLSYGANEIFAEGDQISVIVDGVETSISTPAGAVHDVRDALFNQLQADNPSLVWSKSSDQDNFGCIINVSSSFGEAVLTGGTTDGQGKITYREILPGHSSLTLGPNGEIEPYKYFKDAFGKDLVCAAFAGDRSYKTHPMFWVWGRDLSDGTINQDFMAKNSGNFNQRFTNEAYGFIPQEAHVAIGSDGYSPRIAAHNYSVGGQVYQETGLYFLWSGLSGFHNEAGDYFTYSTQQFSYQQSDSLQVLDKNSLFPNNPAYDNNLNIPSESSHLLTVENPSPFNNIDFTNPRNMVYYNHAAVSLHPGGHKIHGRSVGGIPQFNHHWPTPSNCISFNSTQDSRAQGTKAHLRFGSIGVFMNNEDIKTVGDKNRDALFLSPAGGFFSNRITGYNSYYADKGHSSDAAWGGMNDPYAAYWTDTTYTNSYTGTLSGIGRRYILNHLINTGALDYTPTQDSAFFLSNNWEGPLDKSDSNCDLHLKTTYVTGLQRYSVGSTSANRSIDYYGGYAESSTVPGWMVHTAGASSATHYYADSAAAYSLGNYRDDDPNSDGGEFGNPNNTQGRYAYPLVMKTRPISPNTGLDNYLHKSSQWPYNVLRCWNGGFANSWPSTIKGIRDGLWSWGPDDDFTFEFIYKSTPYSMGTYPSFGRSDHTSNSSASGFDNFWQNAPAITKIEADEGNHPNSFENWKDNISNPSYAQQEHQGLLCGFGDDYNARWLTIHFWCGRLAVVNRRPHRQNKAGEYPQLANWLIGETLLEDDKWYHFAVVKDSSSNIFLFKEISIKQCY